MSEAYVKHDIHIMFKDYNKSVYNWFKDHVQTPFYENETKVLFGTPDKAFAEYVVPIRNGTYEGLTSSLYLADMTFHPYNLGGFVWREDLVRDSKGNPKKMEDGKYYKFREFAATLYDLTYTFTMWSKLQRDMYYVFDVLLEKTSMRRPAAWKLHDHWVILKSMGSIRDESDLEPGNTKNRLFRWSMDFLVERAVRPGPKKFLPIIQTIQTATEISTEDNKQITINEEIVNIDISN